MKTVTIKNVSNEKLTNKIKIGLITMQLKYIKL